MKVFHVTDLGKPPNSRFPEYAELDIQKKDLPFLRLGRDSFSGRPFPSNWKPIELFVATPTRPRPDFYGFGGSALVCDERALELAGEPLEMSGELLPVTIEREPGRYYIHNVTNCINVLDPAKSVWRRFGRKDEFKTLDKPAFIAERFGEESLFKFPEDGGFRICCLERTGEAAVGEFKAIVDHHGLTGLKFDLMWSDEANST